MRRGTVVITGAKGGLPSLFVKAYRSSHPEDHIICLIRDASDYSPLPDPTGPDSGEGSGGGIEHVSCDLSQLSMVTSATSSIRDRIGKGEIPRIKAIVCAASVQHVEGLTMVSDQGEKGGEGKAMEETVTVNHLAHLVVILELLPALGTGGKVVILSAEAYRPDYKFFKLNARYEKLDKLLDPRAQKRGHDEKVQDKGDEAQERDKGLQRYSTSKLLQMLTGNELHRQLRSSSKYSSSGTRVILYNPGVMAGTGLFRHHSALQYAVMQTSIAAPSVANWLEPELGASRKEDSAEVLSKIVGDDAPFGPGSESVRQGTEGGRDIGLGFPPYYGPKGDMVEVHEAARNEGNMKELWGDSLAWLGYGQDALGA